MGIDSVLDLMMVLLYARGFTKKVAEPIRDTTRLVKLLFLLVKEGGFQKFEKEFGFEAWDYGPWGGQIYDNLETLKHVDLVETTEDKPQALDEGVDDLELVSETVDVPVSRKKISIYVLTEKGKKVGKQLYESLSDAEKKNVEEIKHKFNAMRLHNLLEYIYSRYPEVTTKSKIRGKILTESMFGVSRDMPKFKREEEDLRD